MSGAGSVGAVVVGVGRAGGARIRDLKLASQYPGVQNFALKGFVSRRELSQEGTEQLTIEQALERQDVDAVVICTENHSHESIARKALEAGKHVLVEFPLALTSSGAQGLYDLADTKGLVCYEEDIGLLVESHKVVKARMNEKSDLVEASYSLKGRFNGWIEDEEKNGSPFMSSINLLHAMLDLCGDLTPESCTLQRDADSSEAKAQMKTKDGVPVSVSISRHKDGVPRQQTFSFRFADGTVIDNNSFPRPAGPPPAQTPEKPGLFMQDLMSFAGLVNQKPQQKQSDEEMIFRWRTSRALQLSEELVAMAKR